MQYDMQYETNRNVVEGGLLWLLIFQETSFGCVCLHLVPPCGCKCLVHFLLVFRYCKALGKTTGKQTQDARCVLLPLRYNAAKRPGQPDTGAVWLKQPRGLALSPDPSTLGPLPVRFSLCLTVFAAPSLAALCAGLILKEALRLCT